LNVFDEPDALFAFLHDAGRTSEALARLREFARSVVLDAAAVCEARAAPAEKPTAARHEARKCADAVRHFLLCREGESVCLYCDGKACRKCKGTGVKTTLL
jgi:hypothetical protein